MKKSTFCKKAVTLAAAGMLTLSTLVIPATAMDDDDSFYGHGQVFGINLTGDFGFNKVAVNGFSHTQVGGSGSAQSNSPFFHLDNGIAKTEIPFFTFGESVVYPGVFYNSGETQFHHLVANAAAGDSVATSTVTMYAAAAAAAIAVGLVAADASAGGSGNSCQAWIADFEQKIESGPGPIGALEFFPVSYARRYPEGLPAGCEGEFEDWEREYFGSGPILKPEL